MTLVSVTEAKAQCRVTHDLEDSLFQIYVKAADEWVSNYLNDPQPPQKSAIKAAALLIVHDLYFNRGATSEMKNYQNPAVDALLYPYRQDIGI